MTDRLKGSVEFGATIPTGPYQNVKISFSEEFYLDESTHEQVLLRLASKVDEETAKLKVQGLVR
jgi:hypothetical protein